MRRLRTIGAVFRAAAGFDREQAGELNIAGAVMGPVNRLRVGNQIEQRRFENLEHLVDGPIVAVGGHRAKE